jgi:hypothetical protein
MASPGMVRNLTSEELRMKNYQTQLERKNDAEVRDLQSRHAEDVRKELEAEENQLTEMRRAFEVQISKEAESLADRLEQVRGENERTVTDEKLNHQREMTRLKESHKAQLDEYRKQAEDSIERTRKESQATSETIRKQARKTERREGVPS